MSKKKILLISYYFPPLGGAGSARPLMLFKKLPKFGIDVDILTVKPVAYRSFDNSLLSDIDNSKVYRSNSFDPQRILYLLGLRKVKDKTISKGKSLSDSFFPDSKIGWVKPAVKYGRVLAENKNYSVVMTTSPPVSTHLIGMTLANEFSIPFIADFRDYWTSYKPEQWFENNSKVENAYKLLKKISAQASAVTTVSNMIGEFLKTDKVIRNSYNEELAQNWKEPIKDKKFTIGVLGTLDDLCVVEPLFQILCKLSEINPELFSKIDVVQVGNINVSNFEILISKYRLTDKIKIHNYQERSKTIELLNNSHLLYLGLNAKFEDGILTSRIYEMIASGRYILSYTQSNSELATLLAPIENSFTFHNDTYKSGLEYVIKLISQWQSDELKITPTPEYAKPYSSLKMAEKFAELIQNIT